MLKKEIIIFTKADIEKILTLFCKKKFPKNEVKNITSNQEIFQVNFQEIDLEEQEEE
jgi:hypothetical protein